MEKGPSTVRAIVREIDGKDVIVEVEQGGCGRCHEEGGCGGQHLTQMFCGGPKTWRVPNSVDAGVGDRLVIAIGAGNLRRSANLAYVFPLTAAIVGAVVGNALASDTGGILGALGALVASFLLVRYRVRGSVENPDAQPHIVSHS
jgi:sigma-E factor negative regulatory protein RseC